jgi:putative ABC transport system ATP-binding protein
VAIARALVNEPSIILADEPTGNLDSKSSHIIMEELAEVHKKGNTIIMVTHNPELMAYATRIITMFDGKIDTDTKNRSAKKSSENTDEEKNTLDKIEKITEKLDEIKEELGV